jgi:tRNA-splicing ligase RtcB
MKIPKKSDLIKITDYIWEIPQNFREDMKVPARVFATENMLDEILEDKSLWQLSNVATLPGIYKYALAMPDVHEGYGFCVGAVAAFDYNEGIISPGGIGFDINCGVRLAVTDLDYEEVKDKIPKLTEEIFKQVPSGVGRGGFWKLNNDEMKKVLENGAQYIVELGYGEKEDLEATESFGKLEGADSETVSKTAKDRGRDQLGTIGAGNHFVEIQRIAEIFDDADQADFTQTGQNNLYGDYADFTQTMQTSAKSTISKKLGLEKGKIAVLIHCGSRGLGHQVASDYVRKAISYLDKQNIKLIDRELAYFPFEHPDGQNYFSAMKAAANFAFANRQLILHQVRKAFKKVFGKEIKLKQVYDVAHNIAKIEYYADNVYPNDRPNKLPESNDRIESTRITRPNKDIYPNNNRIKYPNNGPNRDEIFGKHSGNKFGPNSGSDIIFGQDSGNSFGPYSGSNKTFSPDSGKIFGHNSGNNVSLRKLIVHRKGATRAFWKGHPELPPKYQEIGQPTLIPGSMGTASYILIGQELAKEISFGSAPHGAGRVMSRAEAKRKIKGSELKKELESRGIAVAAGSMSGLAEEAPEAYKNVNEVVEVVHQIGIAKKLAKLVPVGVIKG